MGIKRYINNLSNIPVKIANRENFKIQKKIIARGHRKQIFK